MLNGNGWADKLPVNELIDPNNQPTDLPEAYVDYNENGLWDSATEPYIDFNQDGAFNVADGKFNGVLCDDITAGRSSAGTCSPTHTLHVRQSQTIVLGSSSANIIINDGANVVPFRAAMLFNSLKICLYVAAFLSINRPNTAGTP